MDKNEYQLKLEEMKNLYAEQDYAAAAAIADTISWRRVRNVNTLCMVGDIYDQQRRYKESRAVLLMAYDKSPVGKNIIYKLTNVAIKYSTYEEAKEFYDEFIAIAPHDNRRYVLKYKLADKKKAPLGDRIAILEELKEYDYTEEWAYELAELYFKAQMTDKCLDACDELIIWFGDGPYVRKAKELKRACQPLITAQGRIHVEDIQEELRRKIDKIANAKDKEAVNEILENIQRMVAEIPVLQMNLQSVMENEDVPGYTGVWIETDEDIDRSLAANFNEMIGEDSDGQMSLRMNQSSQISGQIGIEDVLREWEYTKRVAEAALADADERKLQSAKARAIQDIEALIQILNEIPPVLEMPEIREPEPEQSVEEIEEAVVAETDASEELQDASEDSVKEIAETVTEQVTEEFSEEPQMAQEEEATRLLVRAKEEEAMAELHESVVAQAAAASDEQISKLERASAGMDRLLKGNRQKAGSMDSLLNMLERGSVSEEAAQSQEPIPVPTAEQQVQEVEPIEEKIEAPKPEPEPEPVPESKPEPEPVSKPEPEPVSKPEPEPVSKPEPVSVPESKPEPAPKKEEPKEEHPSRVSQNTARIHLQMTGSLPNLGARLDADQREIFTYFLAVPGMEEQIAKVLDSVRSRMGKDCTSSSGNIIIQGVSGSGKTVLAANLIKALGRPNGKIGKIQAKTLNRKDPKEIVGKVRGGYLIIENAGELSAETAAILAEAMIGNTAGLTVILEDTKYGIRQALALNDAFSRKFTEKINIPIFTIDELVIFAKAYAKEMECVIDELGVLALYNRINNIQKREEATTLMEVKDIVDAAIDSAERGNKRKLFGKRFDEDDNLILHEKDFE